MRLRVVNHEKLYRDPETNAIINTDDAARIAYREKLRLQSEQRKEIETLKDDVRNMKEILAKIWNKLKD